MFREFLGFSSSTLTQQASSLVTSLVAAALLGPEVWGTWFLLNLILRYGALTHLGALNGLNREYALEVGRGNQEEAEQLRKTSLGALAASLLVVILPATAILTFTPSQYLPAIALTILLLVCQQLYSYLSMTFKSRIQFTLLSRLQFAVALATPAITLPLTMTIGLNGFIIGQAITYALVAAFAYSSDKKLYQLRFDAQRTKKLIRIGFPIMIVGVLYALFTTVDRWVILQVMNAEALGHYSLAIMALGAAALLPQVIAQQYYPRMAQRWGANRDLTEMKRLARTQSRLALIPTTVVVLLAEVLGPPLIQHLLPDYTPGIPAFRIILLAPIINTFGQGYANLLNVTDRQYRYIAIIALSIVINLLASYQLAISMGLAGVALGTVIAFAGFSFGIVTVGQSSRNT